jgi:hypothetical protein
VLNLYGELLPSPPRTLQPERVSKDARGGELAATVTTAAKQGSVPSIETARLKGD